MPIKEGCVLWESEFWKERPLNRKGYVTKKRIWAADDYLRSSKSGFLPNGLFIAFP